MFVRKLMLMAVFAAAVVPTAAQAQGGGGFRAGVSADPSQFYLGAHVELGPVVEKLWFRPNIEIGFGSNRVVTALNGEFAYWFPLRNLDWKFYAGAGPAVNIIRIDRNTADDTNVEGGFNILLGLEHQRGFFGELKVGALDSPAVKFGVGYTFH